jgi:hypothetical protein
MIGRLGRTIGRGLLAGLAGTAAMTISSTIEARARARPPSTTPADAAAKVLGIERFASEQAHRRFSDLVHWSYGTGWGVVRAILGGIGLPPRVATAAHFSIVWGGALVLLPALEVTPPVTEWGRQEIAIDAWHHLVYVTATGAAYQLLSGSGRRASKR